MRRKAKTGIFTKEESGQLGWILRRFYKSLQGRSGEYCKFCGLWFESARHVNLYHQMTAEEYFARYATKCELSLKPICHQCGARTEFIDLKRGYRKYCSNKCQHLGQWNFPGRRESHARRVSEQSREYWKNPEHRVTRSKESKAAWKDTDRRRRWIVNMNKAWNNSERRQNASRKSQTSWRNPYLRVRMTNGPDRYLKGTHYSWKAVHNGRHGQAPYASGLEKRVYLKLDRDENVRYYIIHPFTIDYRWNGTTKVYIPDLLIFYEDGTKRLVEIKPFCDTSHPKVRRKARAARKYCQQNKLTSGFWTEKGYTDYPIRQAKNNLSDKEWEKFMKVIERIDVLRKVTDLIRKSELEEV